MGTFARNATILAIEELLDGEAEAVTRKAIETAKEGDTSALRLVLERVAPVRLGRPVLFDLCHAPGMVGTRPCDNTGHR
jgi:hypothetical protein